MPLAEYLSYVLRLEGFDWAVYGVGFLLLVGLACVSVPIVFRRAGVYARYWRYASVDELLLLAGSVTVAVLLTGAISLAAVQLLPTRPPLPRSIPLIFLLLALVATAGPRFAVRLAARSLARKRSWIRGCSKRRWPREHAPASCPRLCCRCTSTARAPTSAPSWLPVGATARP